MSLDSVALPTDRRRTASQKGCGSALSDPKQESAHLQVRVPQLITETLIHVAPLSGVDSGNVVGLVVSTSQGQQLSRRL